MSHCSKFDRIPHSTDELGPTVIWKQLQNGLGLEIKIVALDHEVCQFRADPDVVASRPLVEVRRVQHVADVRGDVFDRFGVLDLTGLAHSSQCLCVEPKVNPGVPIHVEEVALVMPLPRVPQRRRQDVDESPRCDHPTDLGKCGLRARDVLHRREAENDLEHAVVEIHGLCRHREVPRTLVGILNAYLVHHVDSPHLPCTGVEEQAHFTTPVTSDHEDSLASCISQFARSHVYVIPDVVERFIHMTSLCSRDVHVEWAPDHACAGSSHRAPTSSIDALIGRTRDP